MELKELEKQFKSLEKRVSQLEGKDIRSLKKIDKVKEKKSLADEMIDLIEEKFFDKPQSLIEIHNQLRSKAVFYPKTNYPDSLLRLVKNKKLRRLEENKKWVYVKHG